MREKRDPPGNNTLEASISNFFGLAANAAERQSPTKMPNGEPVISRIIAEDSYDVNICVNPSIAIGTAAKATIPRTALVR